MEIDTVTTVADPARRSLYAKVAAQLKESGVGADEVDSFAVTMRHSLMSTKYDEAYMHCLLNPEGSDGSRIPTPFGRQSSLVKQQTTMFLSTGSKGEAMFAYLPQDLHSYGFVQVATDVNCSTIPSETGEERYYPLFVAANTNTLQLSSNFQAARVVGASIRIQYTGDLENETGFLVGGHIYDQQLGMLDVERINESYGTVNCRPSSGLRMAYLPRAEIDFDYTPLDQRVSLNPAIANGIPTAFDGGQTQPSYYVPPQHYARSNETSFDSPAEKMLVLQQRGIGTIQGASTNGQQAVWLTPQLGSISGGTVSVGPYTSGERNVMEFIGTGPRSNQPGNIYPQMCAFYFRGLPANKTWFKVDIVRHLEVIPRFILKEVVSVQRPLSDQVSQAIAKQVGQAQMRLAAHTLQESPKILEHASQLSHAAPDGNSFVDGVAHMLDSSNWGDGFLAKWARMATMPGRIINKAILGGTEAQNNATLIKAIMPVAETAGNAAVKALVGIAKNEFGDSNVSNMIDSFKSRFG